MSARLRWVLNFAGFQIGWFVCVLGAAYGGLGHWWGPLFVLLWLAFHVATARRRATEAFVVLAATAVGCCGDAALCAVGALAFDPAAPRVGPLPVWIVALWALFASSLGESMAWLQRRLWVTAVAGAVFGPLGYRAGVALGATALPADRVAAYVWLGLVWSMSVPAVAWLARRVNGTAPSPAAMS